MPLYLVPIHILDVQSRIADSFEEILDVIRGDQVMEPFVDFERVQNVGHLIPALSAVLVDWRNSL